MREKDRTKFNDFIGYSPESKILQWMLEAREAEFTFNDVIKRARITRQRGYQILKRYHEEDIIKLSQKVKQIKLYKLNMFNIKVKILTRFFDLVIAGGKE